LPPSSPTREGRRGREGLQKRKGGEKRGGGELTLSYLSPVKRKGGKKSWRMKSM